MDSVATSARGWVLSNPGFALTLLGVLAYGFLRFDYQVFYGRLEAKPEDVGLGYAQILSQSVVNVLIFSGLLLGLFAWCWFVVWLSLGVVRMMARDLLPIVLDLLQRPQTLPARVGTLALLFAEPS